MDKHTAGPKKKKKRSFPKPGKSSARILNCQTKVHFPLKQNETSSRREMYSSGQIRQNNTTTTTTTRKKKKNTVKGALIVAHFQEDQTKYQPSQTRSPLCKDAHPKSQAAGWNTRNISCLRCGMPNSGKGLLEKAGRIYMLEKNSFICVKSILKNNPCNQLTLRLDLLVRLKGKSKPLCV